MRLLIVEDDDSVAAALVAGLRRSPHSATRVARASDLLLQHHDHDVVLLDLGLPDLDGIEALRRLRRTTEVPLIVVTARGDEESTVRALRAGADDYVVKPVRIPELLARVEAVARRRGEAPRVDRVSIGDLAIDLAARRVMMRTDEVHLTATEFEMLAELARSAGRAVSRHRLLDAVWGDAYAASSRSFDVHLTALRQKLPGATITTIRGYGYRLETET
ncbi:response regulator transcription factor [Microbacterium imperiale]|uniref:DNA-binding response regulator n=1 Tax=Microbacterium imperiale TaxID=33884 RepID=A0A9W6M4M6_9MICO|nr:response regulator transcription factor [Microbacterium imperiale]MBP2421900.1 DNA-binding response OmpR family regulator [Microbacterium imperiale]MDS0198999.1 response regulator transcription factor [Microbacterium imperiale]BFE39206.1 response regulator transcription factor [Microbacterium imperiale]GLJ81196.1 DNA-binding response regulator [Microbacterium imperiale]